MDDREVKDRLSRIGLRGREVLRRYLIADQPERDAMSMALLRESGDAATTAANLIDMLSLNPEARRRVTRLLGELEATPE
jgi:hypothetical protein